MNILIYRYGSICEPDVISGFEELGNHVTQITDEITRKDVSPSECMQLIVRALSASSYDLVFSINYYPCISAVCNIYQIRYFCWIVDSPVMELYSSTLKNPWNRVFLFDSAQYDEFVSRNPSCIFYLPLATNYKHWDSIIRNSPSIDRQKFHHDVSFVGSLYSEKCQFDQLSGASDYLLGYLDSAMRAQELVYGDYFLEKMLPDDIVREFREHLPGFYAPVEEEERNDRITMAQFYLCPKITMRERIRTMRALGNMFSVALYTGSDTSGIPVCNRGIARTFKEMPLIFHYSKINLNMTAKSIRNGVPLRVFDVLGCGGFLISNYQNDIPPLFSVGTDLVCYGSEDELIQKIEFFLLHDKDREEIAHNGYERVKAYHNFPERLLDMLSLGFGIKT